MKRTSWSGQWILIVVAATLTACGGPDERAEKTVEAQPFAHPPPDILVNTPDRCIARFAGAIISLSDEKITLAAPDTGAIGQRRINEPIACAQRSIVDADTSPLTPPFSIRRFIPAVAEQLSYQAGPGQWRDYFRAIEDYEPLRENTVPVAGEVGASGLYEQARAVAQTPPVASGKASGLVSAVIDDDEMGDIEQERPLEIGDRVCTMGNRIGTIAGMRPKQVLVEVDGQTREHSRGYLLNARADSVIIYRSFAQDWINKTEVARCRVHR